MTDQPEYIDLLNDIRLQEHRAGIWIKAWAEKTEHPGLKGCLSLVAERETSHGDIFDRRIRELGGNPEDKDDDLFPERLRVAGSDMSDAEKIAWMREAQTRVSLPTVRMRYEEAAQDESVDQLTRSLIKWFTEVEDDSGATMRAVYAEVEAGS
jgi:Mn-containing catalase